MLKGYCDSDCAPETLWKCLLHLILWTCDVSLSFSLVSNVDSRQYFTRKGEGFIVSYNFPLPLLVSHYFKLGGKKKKNAAILLALFFLTAWRLVN